MKWAIEKTNGVVYDRMTNTLMTEAGDKIALVYIGKEGSLEISLMMDTDFLSDEGWGTVGFNGCENHIASFVWLYDGGGVLEYQENRHSIFQEPGEKISIRIVEFREGIEGDIVTSCQKILVRNPFLYLFLEFKKLFSSWIGWKMKTV